MSTAQADRQDKSRVSFAECPPTSTLIHTHLKALGAPEYTPQHTDHSHIQHRRKYTQHIPHNAVTVTQKVTEHTTQITATPAASCRDMTHRDTCSDMTFTPLKYTIIDPQCKDILARPTLETAQLKGHHHRLTHQPQKSPKPCICNTRQVCRN